MTNGDEATLGTDPEVFNLFFYSQPYSGFGEITYTDPNPWTFYQETLITPPAEWSGLSLQVIIAFAGFGTEWHWLVDDYASINGTKFLDYGREGVQPLNYDVSTLWYAAGPNTFSATSTQYPQASCQPFTVVLVATPNVSIVPDAGVEGYLGGTIKGTKELAGQKPFEKHFVSPPNLTDNPNGYNPAEDYANFVAQNTTAAQFDTNYKWDTTVGEDVSGDVTKRRVKRIDAGKNVLRVLMHDSGTEVARLNVWIVKSTVTYRVSNGPTPYSPFGGFGLQLQIYFNHTIAPVTLLTDADRPDLTADATGPFTYPCRNLANGATKVWDATRQLYISVVRTPSNLQLSTLDCADRTFLAYPTGINANVIGNDDQEVNDEHDTPTSSGLMTSNDMVKRAASNSDGVAGNKVVFSLIFREFTRLKLNDIWYRLSEFHLWRVNFGFVKGATGWEEDDTTTNVLPYSN